MSGPWDSIKNYHSRTNYHKRSSMLLTWGLFHWGLFPTPEESHDVEKIRLSNNIKLEQDTLCFS